MEKPKFSIVTVCYNAGDKLYETINTALKQTYDNFEIIIKDGLSKDNSLSKVPKDDRISVYSFKDKGIYDALNKGIAMATGDFSRTACSASRLLGGVGSSRNIGLNCATSCAILMPVGTLKRP